MPPPLESLFNSLFLNVNSHCIVYQDDQKMKNLQNEEYYLGDDADEDSRDGTTLLTFYLFRDILLMVSSFFL